MQILKLGVPQWHFKLSCLGGLGVRNGHCSTETKGLSALEPVWGHNDLTPWLRCEIDVDGYRWYTLIVSTLLNRLVLKVNDRVNFAHLQTKCSWICWSGCCSCFSLLSWSIALVGSTWRLHSLIEAHVCRWGSLECTRNMGSRQRPKSAGWNIQKQDCVPASNKYAITWP